MRATPILSLTLLLSGCMDSCRVGPSTDSGDTSEADADADTDTDTDADSDADSGTPLPPTEDSCLDRDPGFSRDFTVEHVIVVVTDGARIDETFGDFISSATGEESIAFTPDIRATLWPEGSVVHGAKAAGATNTAEGHADIVTGYRVPQTNLPSDDGAGFYRPELPTMFEAFADTFGATPSQLPLLANTPHLVGHTWSLHPAGHPFAAEYTFMADESANSGALESDVEMLDAVWDWMQADEVRFLMVNLHQIDRAGHNNGPAEYTGEIKAVDPRIVQLWEDIQADPTYADTTVMAVVADHGRHRRVTGGQDWKEHGDQCSGCRQIPMFLVGPGIRSDIQLSTAYTLDDLGATLAWLADVEMPYASGMIMRDILVTDPEQSGRCGRIDPDAAGDLAIVGEYTGDSDNQQQIVIEGEVLSSPDALLAEAPTLAVSDEGAMFACWRELSLDAADDYDNMPWTGQCRYRAPGSTTWTETNFRPSASSTDAMVSPWFSPALAFDEQGTLWMAFIDNKNAYGGEALPLRVVRWTPGGGWKGLDDGYQDLYFAILPSMSFYDKTAWVAYTTMEYTTVESQKKFGRYTRHVELLRVTADGPQENTEIKVFETFNHGYGPDGPESLRYGRSNRPAVHADADGVSLAYVGYDGDTNKNGLIESSETPTSGLYLVTSDNGVSWTSPSVIAEDGVIGAAGLDFSDSGALDFSVLSDGGTVEVCRHADGTTTCQDTGSVAIQGLTARDDRTTASLYDSTTGRWTITPILW